MHILLIEDNIELQNALKILLEGEGYIISCADNGEEGLFFIERGEFDLVVLDRMLPKLDGLSILVNIREQGIKTPVLMMTALGQISDRVDGLDAGADDYIVKPFDNREFFARVKALLRRPGELIQKEELLIFGDICLDPLNMELKGKAGETTLSAKENSILILFLENPNIPISRETFFAKIWGYGSEVEYSNIDSYIYYVRRRLKTVSKNVVIKTLHKKGYRLEQADDSKA